MKLPMAVFAAVVLAPCAKPAPDLRASSVAAGLLVYADDQRRDLFYYAPGELALARSAEGRPDLHFLEMRYTGNAAAGDRGRNVIRSLLSFRVLLGAPDAQTLEAARKQLQSARHLAHVELRMTPIRAMDSALVYTLAADGQLREPQKLPAGRFEAAEDRAESTAYWTERVYTVNLDAPSAEVFRQSLMEGRLILSLGYAFLADAVPAEEPVDQLRGSPELVSALQEAIGARRRTGTTAPQLVRAGALPVEVDGKRWPELFRRVDLNESVPPEYGVLDVYCYDFQGAARPELYEKQVEIEAEGVTGDRIRTTIAFQRDQPDLYSRSVRFRVAVRLARPYRYRVTEVLLDGAMRTSEWRQRPSWFELLDVTGKS